MARELRLEFPGAVCHVINRGNYRSDVFAAEKTKAGRHLSGAWGRSPTDSSVGSVLISISTNSSW